MYCVVPGSNNQDQQWVPKNTLFPYVLLPDFLGPDYYCYGCVLPRYVGRPAIVMYCGRTETLHLLRKAGGCFGKSTGVPLAFVGSGSRTIFFAFL